MTQVWEYIKIALMNIRSNKGRSILTMLGIIIGISSVIMIISIGNGVKSGINGELNSMAGGQIAVYSSNTAENGTEVVFTEEDMDAILEKVPNVKAVTPSWSFSGSATGRKGTFDAATTFGKAGLEYSSQDPIIKGRYFCIPPFPRRSKHTMDNYHNHHAWSKSVRSLHPRYHNHGVLFREHYAIS